MIAHPTHILRTTRHGSRRPVPWLNQPGYQGEAEPRRRNVRTWAHVRIAEPGAKTAAPGRPWTDASLLLVILHYLLKNNTTFMEWNVQVQVSPQHPSVTTSTWGGI